MFILFKCDTTMHYFLKIMITRVQSLVYCYNSHPMGVLAHICPIPCLDLEEIGLWLLDTERESSAEAQAGVRIGLHEG